MTDREAFLRAIRAHPDDDTPRLIFADWLEEHGDPAQAEFVRLQVELEPIRDQLDQPRVRELAERESILLATHGHDWLGPAADLVGPYPAFGPVFRRGLPEMVCLSLGTFLSRAEELFAACPTVREVCVYGVSGRGAELAACPQLAQVETLEIADPVYTLLPEVSTALCEALRAARVYRVRIPAQGDPPFTHPHLFHSLGIVIATGWPRWVEFVQYSPGARDYPAEYTAALDRIAGRSVTRILRPFERLFPLAADIGHGLYPGIDNDRPTVLALRRDRSGLWAWFDKTGRRTGTSEFGGITHAAVESWRKHHMKSVVVNGFEAYRLNLRLWPRSYINEYLANPFNRPPGVSDHWWESRGGVLKRWLHEGRFVIEWDGREYTADATGKIIAG